MRKKINKHLLVLKFGEYMEDEADVPKKTILESLGIHFAVIQANTFSVYQSRTFW